MSGAPPVIIVMLRQPRRNDPRTDPMYEFGSFGLTGCHDTNLLADTAAAGARLAFAQGGPAGIRLVMLTSPVEIREFEDRREAFWRPARMPLRYEAAPLLIARDGDSDIDGMREVIGGVKRGTWVGKFASAFRSRKRPLETRVARALIQAWERASARRGSRATKYWQALPRRPDQPEMDREAKYASMLRWALGQRSSPRTC